MKKIAKYIKRISFEIELTDGQTTFCDFVREEKITDLLSGEDKLRDFLLDLVKESIRERE